jgi:hypothetical protein
MARFAEAIQQSGVDIVPKVVIGNDGRDGASGDSASPLGGSGNVLEALLAILLSEKLGIDVATEPTTPSPAAVVVREELQRRLESGEAA